MEFVEHNGLLFNKSYLAFFKRAGLDSFDALMDYVGGKEFKRKAARSVVRIGLAEGVCCGSTKAFFLKRHYEEPERKKGLTGLITGGGKGYEDARNEWEKIIELTELDFLTMVPVAYGQRKADGGKVKSLTLTEEIYDAVRVEDYIPKLKGRGFEGMEIKRDVIERLGELAKRFHGLGFNHQDFYLGHFFIRPLTSEIFLVDLQRVQRRDASRQKRWILKDLAQFTFSALETDNFTRTNLARFGHVYVGKKEFDAGDRKMIKKIIAKSERIARHTVKLLERRKKVGA